MQPIAPWWEKANFVSYMDFLGRIRKLDSSLQRGLDNSFARVFGGKVVPNELEECLKQEIEDFLMQDADGQFLAPNDFRIGVSAADFKNLSEGDPNLPRQLAERMTRYCRNNGWGFSGVISVRLQALDSLHTGQLKTASRFTEDTTEHSEFIGLDGEAPELGVAPSGDVAATSASYRPEPESALPAEPQPAPEPGPEPEVEEFPTASRPIPAVNPEPEAPAQAPTRSVSLLLQDGSSRVFEVREGSNIIGRGTASDFRLPDTGVSRQHAEITWDGQDAVLVDLHSTNGTIVNGEQIDNWLLADGDTISLGHSLLEVRIR